MKGQGSAIVGFHRAERGQTLIVLSLMFVVLIGLAAMVTDAGLAYWNRRFLQNAVDAAALAGANELARAQVQQGSATLGTAAAIQAASQYAQQNGVQPSELLCNPVSYPFIANCTLDTNPVELAYTVQVTTTYNPSDTMVVTARRQYNFGLRYVLEMLGVTQEALNTSIVATASALVGPVGPGSGDLMPWAALANASCLSGGLCTIKVGPKSSSNGNFGAVDFPPNPSCGNNGADCYGYYIVNGYTGTVPPPQSGPPYTWNWSVSTETGNMAGPTSSSVQQLLQWDAKKLCDGGNVSCDVTDSVTGSKYYVPAPDSTYNPLTSDGTVCYKYTACPRVGIVPILSNTSWPNGTSTSVTVTGFKCFYITGLADQNGNNYNSVQGYFVNDCVATPGGRLLGGGSLDSTGQVGVVLWR